MPATLHLHSRGFCLPAIPAPARQEAFALEPSASLPRGYELRETARGLELIRTRDGEGMGIMSSVERACSFASALTRMESQREDATR